MLQYCTLNYGGTQGTTKLGIIQVHIVHFLDDTVDWHKHALSQFDNCFKQLISWLISSKRRFNVECCWEFFLWVCSLYCPSYCSSNAQAGVYFSSSGSTNHITLLKDCTFSWNQNYGLQLSAFYEQVQILSNMFAYNSKYIPSYSLWLQRAVLYVSSYNFTTISDNVIVSNGAQQ